MTYIGSIGDGADGVHHIFEDLAKQADCYVLCEAARTDALEFNDGKLMLQHLKCLDKVNYPRLLEVIGEEKLIALFREADLVALNHWSSLIHMTDIWCQLQKHICPKLDAGKRRIFFDLADPEKREPVDIIAALECLADFSKWYDVSLGLNEKEAEHICEISGSNITNSDPKELALERASYIHKNLNIDCVTIHPRAFAAAVNQDTEAVVDGPFIEKPKISTGAGDHFNAGFSLAQTLGADLDVALQCGVATSGYYVRNAISPNRQQLKEFIETLN